MIVPFTWRKWNGKYIEGVPVQGIKAYEEVEV
jgi:hypothetical protein